MKKSTLAVYSRYSWISGEFLCSSERPHWCVKKLTQLNTRLQKIQTKVIRMVVSAKSNSSQLPNVRQEWECVSPDLTAQNKEYVNVVSFPGNVRRWARRETAEEETVMCLSSGLLTPPAPARPPPTTKSWDEVKGQLTSRHTSSWAHAHTQRRSFLLAWVFTFLPGRIKSQTWPSLTLYPEVSSVGGMMGGATAATTHRCPVWGDDRLHLNRPGSKNTHQN